MWKDTLMLNISNVFLNAVSTTEMYGCVEAEILQEYLKTWVE